jgi:hypothetical protein
MHGVSGSQEYDVARLLASWAGDRDSAVFIVDETKTAVDETTSAGRELAETLVVFTGFLATSGELVDLLIDLARIRATLPEMDRDRSFKSSDLWRSSSTSTGWEIVHEYERYTARIAAFCKDSRRVHCLASTDQRMEDVTARITLQDGNGRRVENHGVLTRIHSVPFVTWLKRVATREEFGPGYLFVLVDGSQDLALAPGKSLRISDLNRRPDGRATVESCEACFDVFVGSDREPPLRDALMVPDFWGNFALRKLQGHAPGYDKAKHALFVDGENFYAWDYDAATWLEPSKPVG